MMKRIKNALVYLSLATVILAGGSDILAKIDESNYAYVDDKHAVSNILHKNDTEYTYSLFCIETQKVQPSTEKTIRCNFCEEDITGAYDYVSTKHANLVKENNELLAEAQKLNEKFDNFKNGAIIFGGLFIVAIIVWGMKNR